MKTALKAAAVVVVLAGLAAAGLLVAGVLDPIPKHTVTGTVKRDGQPLTWPDGGSLLVLYYPTNDTTGRGPVYRAETDTATSGYRVAGLPAGRYRVAVQQFDEHFMDGLGGRYDPGATRLEVEVTHDGQVIDIDLPKDLPKRELLPDVTPATRAQRPAGGGPPGNPPPGGQPPGNVPPPPPGGP